MGRVADIEGLELLHGIAEDALPQDKAGDVRHHILMWVGGARGQLPAALVEQEDGGRVELHHLGSGAQHRLDVLGQRQGGGEKTTEPVQQLNLGVGSHVGHIIGHDF